MRRIIYPAFSLVFGLVLTALVLLALNGFCQLLLAAGVKRINWRADFLRASMPKAQVTGAPRKFEIKSTFSKQLVVNSNPAPMLFDLSEIATVVDPSFYVVKNGLRKAQANRVYHEEAFRRRSSQRIYDALYTIGPDSFRITPLLASSKKRDQYALFIGDSFTFGTGVMDNETLPYYFGEKDCRHKPYNFGLIGNGPNDVLVQTRNAPINQIVREKNGIVVYTYIDAHLTRLIGTLGYLATWGAPHPYVYETQDGRIEQRGDFEHSEPLRTSLARFLINSSISQFFELNYLSHFSDSDFEFFARVISSIRDEYLKILPESYFLFVFYPSPQSNFADTIIPLLEKYKIRYLDYSKINLNQLTKEPVSYKWDGHPTAAAYRILARQIQEDLVSAGTLQSKY